MGVPGSTPHAGEKGFHYFLQTDGSGAALVCGAAFTHDGDLYYFIRKYCEAVDRWCAAGVVLSFRHHGLELFLRKSNEDVERLYGERRNVWQSLFPTPDYAAVDCRLLADEVCRTVWYFYFGVAVLRALYRGRAAELVDSPYAAADPAHGHVCVGNGHDFLVADDEI